MGFLANEDFKEITPKKCSFCEKTYNEKAFFSVTDNIYSDDKLLRAALRSIRVGRKPKKSVEEGICFNCLIKGICSICKNDTTIINKHIELYLKEKIVENL